MKKMLLLLAGMACLGMFVSCSDDPQEVAIVEMTANSVVLKGYADGAIVGDSLNVDTTKWATLTYDKYTEGSRTYTLKVPYIYSSYDGSDTITIVEIDGKYYDNSTQKQIDVKGSVSGGDFTVTVIKGQNYTYTNLSFKKGVTK